MPSIRYGLGTIPNINQGGTLDAGAAGGVFSIGKNGQSDVGDWYYTNNNNVVNVGQGCSDTATLKTATLIVGDSSNGILNISGSSAVVTVNTGACHRGQHG